MRASNNTISSFAPPSHARTVRLVDVPLAEVRFRLVQALGQEGFAVLNELDLADLLNRRLDEHRDPYFTYEVCHPKLAEDALAVSADAGLLLPCKICVWHDGHAVVVATLPPSRLATALGRQHLDAVAGEAEERLERVFDRLNAPAPAAFEIPPRASTPLPALSTEELLALREATQNQIHALLAESAGTESHSLQHAIAKSIDHLENVARKLAPGKPARANG
jgi:uncharacterized protein (DUF302 family)